MPYEPVGVWLIDQWRQIGVNVKQVNLESAAWFTAQKEGEHEVSTNAPCNSIVEPDLDLHWFLGELAGELQPAQGHGDGRPLHQAVTRDGSGGAAQAPARVREAALRRGSRTSSTRSRGTGSCRTCAKVRGWTITPSHFLNQQLDTVWLAE